MFNIIAKLNTYDRLLEVEDVVEVFGFSKSKVYRMSESKQIPAAMMGGTWKFDPSALAMWTASKDPNIAKAYRLLLKENKQALEEYLRHFKN